MKQGYVMFEDKLQGEYKEAFQYVEMYSTTNLIGVDADSELMMELLDHMLVAQEHGQPVSDIVGEDIEVFCENFFSEYKGKDRFLDFLKNVYHIAWILFWFELLDLGLSEEKGALFGMSDIGGVMIGAACGMVLNLIVYVLIRPMKQKIRPGAFRIISVVLLIGCIVLCVILSNQYSLMVPRWVSIGIPVVYILVYKIMCARANYKKYGSVKAPKQETVSFWGSVKTSVEEELPGDWLKQFEKKNTKRVKKGKEPLTETQFFEKLDKQYNYRKNSMINYCIFGGCTIVTIIMCALQPEGFESLLDFLIFCILLTGIESSICYLINKSGKIACRAYTTMRTKMNEEHLTLAQYVSGTTESLEQEHAEENQYDL